MRWCSVYEIDYSPDLRCIHEEVFGPHVANFRTDVELLLEAGAAVQVRDVAELERTLVELLRDPARRDELGRRAVELIRANQGATGRTRALIEPLVQHAVRVAGPR